MYVIDTDIPKFRYVIKPTSINFRLLHLHLTYKRRK